MTLYPYATLVPSAIRVCMLGCNRRNPANPAT